MKRLIWIYNYIVWKLTKKKYWYQVKCTYRDNKGEMLFDYFCIVGLADQTKILNLREVKKLTNPWIYKNSRHLLCNGCLDVEIKTYLGFFNQNSIEI